jgi:hypothetical protein
MVKKSVKRETKNIGNTVLVFGNVIFITKEYYDLKQAALYQHHIVQKFTR